MTRRPDVNQVSITRNGKTFVASTKPPSRLVADRVFEVIDELCEQTSEPVWLIQKDLADFLEVAPQTLSVAINQLRVEGRLEIIRRGNDYGYRTIRADVQMPMIAAVSPKKHAPRQGTDTGGATAGESRKPRTDMSVLGGQDPRSAGGPDEANVDGETQKRRPSAGEAQAKPARNEEEHISEGIPDEPRPADEANVDGEIPKRRRSAGEAQVKPAHSAAESSGEAPANRATDPSETLKTAPVAESTWIAVLSEIRKVLPAGPYTDFAAPTVGVGITTDELVVATRSSFAVEWLSLPLHHSIVCDAVAQIYGSTLPVRYVVQPDKCPDPERPEQEFSSTGPVEKAPTPCPECGDGTMEVTTWECMKSLPGTTYYCRGTGKCSRLWNTLVGEFHGPNQPQLNYSEAPRKLNDALEARGMRVSRARARRPGSRLT